MAPQAPDTCIYGDYEGLLDTGLRCLDIPVQRPWMCYEPRYQDMCCQTCDSLRNPTRAGIYSQHVIWMCFESKVSREKSEMDVCF